MLSRSSSVLARRFVQRSAGVLSVGVRVSVAPRIQCRYLSNEDFRKTLNDVKAKLEEEKKKEGGEEGAAASAEGAGSSSSEAPMSGNTDLVGTLRGWTYSFIDNVKLAYAEMTASDGKDTLLERKLEMAESFVKPKKATNEDGEEVEEEVVEEEEKPRGPSAIVVLKEGKSAWESMKERLQESPYIREILKRTRVAGKVAADTDIGKKAQNVAGSVKDKIEDMREIWETSQNPIVYTLSGVWENMTGDTEEGMAIAEIRKLDSKFIKEDWAEEVRTKLAPNIIKAHLEGDLKTLKPWLGEAVFNKLAADIRIRKTDGIVFDSNILNIEENQVIMRLIDGGAPVVVIVYMVQQINCIKNKAGEVIEGGETDIRAKFYSIAFQQFFNEEDGSVKWKIIDYEFAGDIPYY